MRVVRKEYKTIIHWCKEDIDLFKLQVKFFFGSMKNYAAACGISSAYLSAVLSQKKNCPEKLYHYMMEVFNGRKRIFEHRSTFD